MSVPAPSVPDPSAAELTAPEPGAARSTHAQATTPTLRATARRWRLWLVLAAVAIVGLLLVAIVSGGGGSTREPYSITDASPRGSKALAEVLRQEGVDVVEAGTLDEARDALKTTPDATLAFADPNAYLDDSRLASASELADTVVLLLPGTDELQAFAPGIAPAGPPENTDGTTAGCSLPAAERAGTITGDGRTYRDVGAHASDLCFRSWENAYSLVRTESDGRTVTVLGTPDVLSNEGIAGAGNAALALGLLGENDTLVWYVPTVADIEADGSSDITSLTPDWVTPVLLLGVATFLAAAVWRGRRLGALVIENLPVTVRSRETMEGRARLYARAGAQAHALDSLRIGTITRLTSVLGLPRNATVTEVAASAAALLPDWPAADIEAVLVQAVPDDEAQMMALSERLLQLERAVAKAARP
jgi:hypothetical protein